MLNVFFGRWRRRQTFLQIVFVDVARGDELARVAALLPHAGAIDRGRPSDSLVEARAERTQAFKADRKTNLRNRELAVGQELFGALDALARQVLMRSLPKGLEKRTEKVKPRKMRRAGHCLQIERMIELSIDEVDDALPIIRGHTVLPLRSSSGAIQNICAISLV
jgi:hypothetical protein